jgi:O-antigen/teichoic acid export membrane protein
VEGHLLTDSRSGDQPETAKAVSGRRELRSLVVSGLRWKGASQVLIQIFSFASTLILARLLTPRDFGLAGLATVFAGLAFLFADLGLGASIVQRQKLTEEDRSTAFWSNAGLGLVLTVAGVGLSWPLADLYRQPDAQPLFAVISLTFLFTALGTTQGALLIRSLSFRSLELRTIVATSASVVIGIGVAVLGYGPWAIISQSLAGSGVSTLLLWRSSPWRPRFIYSSGSLRHLLGFGGLVFGTNLVRYFERNVDNFLIGRFRGPAALGAYGIAYNVMLVPLMKIVLPVQAVFFPFMSRIHEPKEVGGLWLRTSRILAAVVVPGLLGLAIVAPDFVDVVLGEKWQASIHVLQILAWVGMIQIAAAETTNLMQALGRAGIVFRYAIVSAILSIAGFAIGLHWGIIGVAIGYAIANTLLIPFYVTIGGRAVGVSLGTYCRAFSGVVQAAAVMGLVVLGLRLALLDRLAAGPRLVVLIAAGIAVYLPLCRWRAPEIVQEIRRVRAARNGDPEAPRGLRTEVGG